MADDFQNQVPQITTDANQLQQAVSSAMAEQKKKKKKKKLIIIIFYPVLGRFSSGSTKRSTQKRGKRLFLFILTLRVLVQPYFQQHP